MIRYLIYTSILCLAGACATGVSTKAQDSRPDPKVQKQAKKPKLRGVGPRGLGGGPKRNVPGTEALKAAKKMATSGDLKGAISQCQKALEENKSLVEAYLLMGSLLDLAGHSDKALIVYGKGLKNGADPAPLNHAIGMLSLEANQINEAIEALMLADKAMSPPNADLKADLAYAYLLAGKTQEGLEAAKQARALNPKSFAAVYTQGEAYFRLKQNELAVASFREAVNLAPKEVSARRRLGQALNQAEKFEEAKKVFEVLLQQNPKDTKTHVALAGVWLSLKQTKKAVKSMEAARDLAPQNVGVLKLLAHTYEKAGMKKKARNITKKIKLMESKK